jgi:cobalamin biosynthesis protein CobT
MKLFDGGWAVICALGLALGCVVAGDEDDDQGEGSQGTEGGSQSGSQSGTQSAGETQPMTSDPTTEGGEDGTTTSDPEEDSGDSMPGSESLDDGDTGMGGLSPECDALCGHTPTALDAEADCVAAALNKLGGHAFEEPSCQVFTEAFDAGSATTQMCEQCYLDAGVAAEHCGVAEDMCFFFP